MSTEIVNELFFFLLQQKGVDRVEAEKKMKGDFSGRMEGEALDSSKTPEKTDQI